MVKTEKRREEEMEEQPSKEEREAQMLNTINQLAEKYGCKVEIDFDNQTIEFDCPDKQSELDLAMEIKAMMGPEEEQ
jgi:hypothetical protein